MTNVGAANELLIHNENAVVIKIGDEKELLAEMIRIIEDNEFRKKICEANKDLSKKLLSEEETLQAYKDNWIKIAHEKFI